MSPAFLTAEETLPWLLLLSPVVTGTPACCTWGSQERLDSRERLQGEYTKQGYLVEAIRAQMVCIYYAALRIHILYFAYVHLLPCERLGRKQEYLSSDTFAAL